MRDRVSSSYGWYVVVILMAAYTLAFVDRMILNLLVGDIRVDLNISDTRVSLLQGMAFAVLYLICGVPFGRLVDAFSRKAIIIAGILFWSAATVICGFATTFWGLFFARMAVGVGEAALAPAAYSMLADYFTKDRLSRALSLFSAGIWIGSGLALLLGSAVLEVLADSGSTTLLGFGPFAPWQVAFMVAGAPGLIVAAMMMTVREPQRQALTEPTSRAKTLDSAQFADVLRFIGGHWRFFVSHYGGFALFTLLAQAILAWSPTLLIRAHDVDAVEVGIALGVLYLVFSVAGIYIGGLVADKLVARGSRSAPLSVGAFGTLFLAPATIAFALAPTYSLAITFGAAMAFFISMPLGVAASAIQLISPTRMRGQLSALYVFSVGIIGIGIGPAAVALLTDGVFADDLALPRSLALVALCAGPIAFGLLISGRRQMAAMAGEPQR